MNINKILHLLLFFICAPIISLSQTNTIQGEVYSLSSEEAILGKYYKDEYIFLDTVQVLGGKFEFQIESNSPIGMYFVQVDPYKTIELIFNKENIDFSTEYYHHIEDLREKSSVANKRYYQKLQELQKIKKELQNHRVLSLRASRSDEEKAASRKSYEGTKVQLNLFFKALQKSKKEFFSDAFVLAQNQPFVDEKLNIKEKDIASKKSYFDYIDPNDTILLYSNTITRKIYNYIIMFRDRSLSEEAQDSSYHVAIDQIIHISKNKTLLSEFMNHYLVDNFARMSVTKVLPYLKKAYLKQFKTPSEVTEEIDEILTQIESLTPGHIAPNFTLSDQIDNPFELHKYEAEYTLVMFWASWCSHCRHTLPIVKILYDEQTENKVQVVAVALDTKKEEWLQFLNGGTYNWINVTDLKGWGSEVAKNYMVHSTPTFYLLDKDKKIIKKSAQISQLESYFK